MLLTKIKEHTKGWEVALLVFFIFSFFPVFIEYVVSYTNDNVEFTEKR